MAIVFLIIHVVNKAVRAMTELLELMPQKRGSKAESGVPERKAQHLSK